MKYKNSFLRVIRKMAKKHHIKLDHKKGKKIHDKEKMLK